ncbi:MULTISPECIES: OB-fold-containig protein [unclassified Nodularia (in: cyanobacteria)]|uniref:OB-fold-containig protein n=1 Tax=unclassified Nodularia (in: cyanobacteria) TaxID=2656917 RepID=UPI00188119B1|nr:MULTISPECIES: OB-fold-containig protein [unclassified Nodularia (in: cyanobacteria)]MBE9197894.1 DUF1449 family protein [Nodularia sp. LEGE 06071]MCC2695490.1 DUF1449 family protein [Nodularia sp. LEGE 04288]
MLFSQANLPYWIFLGMGVLLFLFVIISGGGDADADADAEFDADADGEFSFGAVLGWIGIGKAPLILLLAADLSLWGVFGLILNTLASGIIHGDFAAFIRGAILLISLIISLLVGRFIAEVIGKIFADFGEDASSDRLIGCVGTVTSFYIPSESEGKIGQVDVLDIKNNFLTISAALPEWATIAPQRGEQVIVIENKSQNYLVIAKDTTDEQLWLANSSQKNQT